MALRCPTRPAGMVRPRKLSARSSAWVYDGWDRVIGRPTCQTPTQVVTTLPQCHGARAAVAAACSLRPPALRKGLRGCNTVLFQELIHADHGSAPYCRGGHARRHAAQQPAWAVLLQQLAQCGAPCGWRLPRPHLSHLCAMPREMEGGGWRLDIGGAGAARQPSWAPARYQSSFWRPALLWDGRGWQLLSRHGHGWWHAATLKLLPSCSSLCASHTKQALPGCTHHTTRQAHLQARLQNVQRVG